MTTQGRQRKNLLIIHLESISNTILWQYRAELATVWRLMRQSMFYSRFQAIATSTTQCIDALYAGTDVISDYKPYYKHQGIKDPYANLYSLLGMSLRAEYGYASKYFFLDHFTSGSALDESPSSWVSKTSDINVLLGHMDGYFEEWKNGRNNFVASFQNDVSHMAFDDEVKIRSKTFSERFRLAYFQMDASINALLQLLVKHGFWENTLVVCYGDHGDELWSHTLARGFCHAIAPYASLAWTPLFIYNNGEDVGVSDRLFSMVDMKETLIKRLIPDYRAKFPKNEFGKIPFHGIDQNRESRRFAFSQNLYALQLEYSDREKTLTKSYSVTDGVYRLIASSGGRRPKDGGLEFYYDRLDPTNSRNLLDFFRLGVDGDIIGFYPPPEATSPEFRLLFSPETVRHMIESFRVLRRELHEYVRAKEAEALKYNRNEHHVMPETAFRRARRRLRKDYDE